MLEYAKARDNEKTIAIYCKYGLFCTIGDMTQEEKNFITFRGRIAKHISEILRRVNETKH